MLLKQECICLIVGRLRLTTPAKNSLIVDFSSDIKGHAFPYVLHCLRVVAWKAECVLVTEGSVGHVGFVESRSALPFFTRNGWAECVLITEDSVGHVGFCGT